MQLKQPDVIRHKSWGTPKINGKWYQRPSTLAKKLDDEYSLNAWRQAMVALGMARRPDLVRLASTIKKDNWREAAEIVDRAHDTIRSSEGRDTGTAIHRVAEWIDNGEDVSHIDPTDMRDVMAFRKCREQFKATSVFTELFVVNEALKAAGTLDNLVEWEGLRLITDIKTGDRDAEYARKYNALSWSIQLAIYANAEYPYGYKSWDEVGGPPFKGMGVI